MSFYDKKMSISRCGLRHSVLSATKAIPKEVLSILTKQLLQCRIEEAESTLLEDMFIVTGRGKCAIEDHFDPRHF